MSDSIWSKIFESEADEAARLASSPVGSSNERLSHLPVTVPYIATGMIIELPNTYTLDEVPEPGRLIVLVADFRGNGDRADALAKIRRDGWYRCIVVADHTPAGSSNYKVGGYDIVVGEDELRRGRQITPEMLLSI